MTVHLKELEEYLPDPPRSSFSPFLPGPPLPPCVTCTNVSYSPLYNRYRADLVLCGDDVITSFFGILPVRYTREHDIPLRIRIPVYMPAVETPWIIADEPINLLGPGVVVYLPLLGRVRITEVIWDNSQTCILKAAALSNGAMLFLQAPREWVEHSPYRLSLPLWSLAIDGKPETTWWRRCIEWWARAFGSLSRDGTS
ncbi:hypothetical protein K466DRAFT_599162 [Polyporus arcularius HHB13444]|uniref:Uncharacterized protein n=1 Tax=Polyporus arcularius HHB13444 TaxID=1314778 RepID=A0A5C3PGV5_9APHY|nr:hypothetical protein K466DRAFT_599162 [Polyporus arcularius HHB13444]